MSKIECRKKKGIIEIMLIFLLVCIVISGMCIYKINAVYPQAKRVFVPKGEFHLVCDNIALAVKDVHWLEKEQIEEKYHERYGDLGALVKITLKNTGNKEEKFPLYLLYMENNQYYWNGLVMEMYSMETDNDSVQVVLQPQEEKEVCLAYTLSERQFTAKEWNKIKENQFYLVNERYPEKVYWEWQ